MQRTAGNRAVTRMLAAPGLTGARLQRTPLDDVKKVRSFNVEEKQAGQATLQKQLDRRLKKRKDEIPRRWTRRRTRPANRRCPLISPSRSTTSSRPRTPKASTPNCVQTSSSPPPPWGRPRPRPRPRRRRGRSTTRVRRRRGGQDAGRNRPHPADLKALIARESGDLTENPQARASRASPRSASRKRTRRWHPPGPQTAPQAIPLAAKVLVDTAGDLKKALKTIPKGDDWKKFLFAAYNAGVYAIAAAQSAAKTGTPGQSSSPATSPHPSSRA